MAELVDAHASGACWLSQWKFESSPGHHNKRPPFMEVFYYGILQITLTSRRKFDYKQQADGRTPVAKPAAQRNEQCASIVEDSLLQGTIIKTDPNGSFFIMVNRDCCEQGKRQQPQRTDKVLCRHFIFPVNLIKNISKQICLPNIKNCFANINIIKQSRIQSC